MRSPDANRHPGPGGADRNAHSIARYERSARLKKRSYLKLDRFEWAKVRREYRLHAMDLLLLLVLAALCDYQDACWSGTIEALAQDTGATWRAVDGALKRLDERDVIRVVRPFARNHQGEVQVLVLDRLLLDAKRVVPIPAEARKQTPEPHLSTFRANPAQNPRIDTNADALSSKDARAAREQARDGGKGSTSSRENVRDVVALLKREFNAREVSA